MPSDAKTHAFLGPYTGENLNRVAFPIGGLGAGMYCLEGTGAISHMSVRNRMDFFHEPCTFAAVCVKGGQNVARVLEGPVPHWKYFGGGGTGNGAGGKTYGLPRFDGCTFQARFPFATIDLADKDVPLSVSVTGWSPFIPGDADRSSLPVGALEYRFSNPSGVTQEAVFSFNTKNFMATEQRNHGVAPCENGFALYQKPGSGKRAKPEAEGWFAAYTDDPPTVVDHCWFKGGWWDAFTLAWRNVAEGILRDNPPQRGPCPGASLFVPFTLKPGEEKTIRLMTAWYVPNTDMRHGEETRPEDALPKAGGCGCSCDCASVDTAGNHVPWYAGRFKDIGEVSAYWRAEYDTLRADSMAFSDAFYSMSLPAEVLDAVAANLTILKSPTILRQTDGRMWGYEGCCDGCGCCTGSCTHVWNYAQSICHLFPDLERSLRHTGLNEALNADGSQRFRVALPIRPGGDSDFVAVDGQLGGIMQMYREWRILGDTDWLRGYWPRITLSLDHVITHFDPRETGLPEESHHNTYDINYWGPDSHCGTFYVGALAAAIKMGEALGEDVSRYRDLLAKGKQRLETELFNGEYFFQQIEWEGYDQPYEALDAKDNGPGYQDIVDLLNTQGPKYQYGTGCLADGILGLWMARMCGLEDEIVDRGKVRSHLRAVYTHNLRHDLSDHANPQRPSYALGHEGGLLLCTWPRGGALALPFVYSDEVWTGIEYQVASHLILEGMLEEGLEIVRIARSRHDGTRRNPFNEYECGHWYARAMSSYGLLEALTGVRYDAVDKTLYIDSRIGDFRGFLATNTGFGLVETRGGKPSLDVKRGRIDVRKVVVSGRETALA